MKFEVRFHGKTRWENVVTVNSFRLGLAHLDDVRELTGVPGLDPARVDSEAPALYQTTHTVCISEEMARDSNLFWDRGMVEVTMDRDMLNPYVIIWYEPVSDPTTGEVKEVRVHRKVDNEALLQAWADAGYPLRWTNETEDEGEDEDED